MQAAISSPRPSASETAKHVERRALARRTRISARRTRRPEGRRSTAWWNSYSHIVVAPAAMPKIDLLPGVTSRSCPPRVVIDAHAAIRKARHRAMLRDAMQVILLVAVDYLFVHWPE